VVPIGANHTIENGDQISNELRIEASPPGESVHEITAGSKGEGDLVIGCGLIDVRYGNSFGLFDQLTRIISVDLTQSPQALTAFQGILDEQSRAVAGQDTMTAALMTQCLVHFFRELPQEGRDAMPWLDALQDDRLGRVVEEVISKPGADHSVDSMADTAAMSRSAFSSMFLKSFGRSPMRFVNHTRMQHAAELLANQPVSIDEVAKAVGYASRSHFSRAFKDHAGMSPQAFRAGGPSA
jgi:AraC-like DNA-binding protein